MYTMRRMFCAGVYPTDCWMHTKTYPFFGSMLVEYETGDWSPSLQFIGALVQP